LLLVSNRSSFHQPCKPVLTCTDRQQGTRPRVMSSIWLRWLSRKKLTKTARLPLSSALRIASQRRWQ
jgi:hypothetical protein